MNTRNRFLLCIVSYIMLTAQVPTSEQMKSFGGIVGDMAQSDCVKTYKGSMKFAMEGVNEEKFCECMGNGVSGLASRPGLTPSDAQMDAERDMLEKKCKKESPRVLALVAPKTDAQKLGNKRYEVLQSIQNGCISLNQKNSGSNATQLRNSCACIASKSLSLMTDEGIAEYQTTQKLPLAPEKKQAIAKECSKP